MVEISESELPSWASELFAVRSTGATVACACAAAGVAVNLVYRVRRQNPAFAAGWAAATRAAASAASAAHNDSWQARFLQALSAGTNVTAAAQIAGVSKAMVYLERRKEAFRRAWDAVRPVVNRSLTPAEWRDELLRLIRTGATLHQAARHLHTDHPRVRAARQVDPAFDATIRQALRERPRKLQPVPWQEQALAARRSGATVEEVAVQVGVQPATIYLRLRTDPAFRTAWDTIVLPPRTRRQTPLDWQARFLEALAACGNAWQAAQRSDIPLPRAYQERAANHDFRTAWDRIMASVRAENIAT